MCYSTFTASDTGRIKMKGKKKMSVETKIIWAALTYSPIVIAWIISTIENRRVN